MIPARFAPILFGFILSGLMSALVSAIATFQALPDGASFLPTWLGAWMSSWVVAFPAVLVVAPIARRLVGKLTRPD